MKLKDGVRLFFVQNLEIAPRKRSKPLPQIIMMPSHKAHHAGLCLVKQKITDGQQPQNSDSHHHVASRDTHAEADFTAFMIPLVKPYVRRTPTLLCPTAPSN